MTRRLLLLAAALVAGACGNTTTTPTPPPPTEDPPTISCPASQTIQLTGTATSVTATYAPTFSNGKAPVTAACTPPSGSSFTIGQSTVTCTATDALQRSSAPCSFTVTVTAPPKLTLTRFVSFGDSITAGEDGIDGGPDTSGLCVPVVTTTSGQHSRVILPDAQTYPGQLQAQLQGRYATQSPSVLKRGCPGEYAYSNNTRARFDAIVSTGQYDVVLIMEGSNDIESPMYTDPIGTAAAGLRSMVGDAKSVGVKPLLATVPPMNPAGRRGSAAAMVPLLNDRIQQVAVAENVPLVDVYAAFKGNLTLLGNDGLHPNAGGYTVIASAFFDVIKSTFEVKSVAAPVLSFKRR